MKRTRVLLGEKNLIQTNFRCSSENYKTKIEEGSVVNKEKNGTENKGTGE
jgi:hypothetical protein